MEFDNTTYLVFSIYYTKLESFYYVLKYLDTAEIVLFRLKIIFKLKSDNGG